MRSFDFEITRMMSDQVALHSVKLPLFINLACTDYNCNVFCCFKGVSSLSKCSTLMSSLLATVMVNWEVHRDVSVDQSSLHFKVTCFITDVMTKVCRFCCTLSALPLEAMLLRRCAIRTGKKLMSLILTKCLFLSYM